MAKQPSIVTVARQGDGYSVDARGAFGGGYSNRVTADELPSAIVHAYQRYGSNPLGFEVVGELTPEAQDMVSKLTSLKDKGLMLRMSEAELDLVRMAAESAGKSINQWIREVVVTEAMRGGKHQ